jgi:hypothetical protein
MRERGTNCRHGSTWEKCPDCELADALETVRRHGEAVDRARIVIAKHWREIAEGRKQMDHNFTTTIGESHESRV